MASDAADRLDKIRKLLAALAEVEDQRTAILRELEIVAGGGKPIGKRLQAVRAGFIAARSSLYAGDYHWQKGKDDALAKKLLERFDEDELVRRADRFIRDRDPFLLKNGHIFGLFYSGVNRYAEHVNRTDAGRRSDRDGGSPADVSGAGAGGDRGNLGTGQGDPAARAAEPGAGRRDTALHGGEGSGTDELDMARQRRGEP